jgi:hypothetical protein
MNEVNLIVITEDRLRQIIREEIKALMNTPVRETESDTLLNIDQCAEYILNQTGRKPAKATIYNWCFNRSVPFKKYGKHTYFKRSEIDLWLSNGRQIIH